jgi:hypothetical protein
MFRGVTRSAWLSSRCVCSPWWCTCQISVARARVGCPVCNKLVVVLLGSSGALTYFAPVQPLLGLLAVTLSATALAVRLRGFFAGCKV